MDQLSQNLPGIVALAVIWPTVTLALLVLSLAFLGDGVNDSFNPRTKD